MAVDSGDSAQRIAASGERPRNDPLTLKFRSILAAGRPANLCGKWFSPHRNWGLAGFYPMCPSESSNRACPRKFSRRRLWGFRVTAILLAMLPWMIAEVALRATGWPPTTELEDPFIGFDSTSPLFTLDSGSQQYVTADNRLVYFRPQRFSAHKNSNEVRIFVLGGSTVQGRPYEVETAFSTWLQLALETADPSRQWTVVNCGGVSYASYRLVALVDEILSYEPDLLILCTGNNEFLESRSYESYLEQPLWLRKFSGWTRQLATVRAVQKLLAPADRQVTEKLPTEVDAQLDYKDALETYQRDDAWSQAVYDHFRRSLERIAFQAKAAKVPVWLVLPPTNYRDCPPFKSGVLNHESSAEAELIRTLQEGWYDRPLSQRKTLLESFLSEEPRYALAHYWLGRCYDEENDYENAAQAYAKAMNEDLCPLRATGTTSAILQQMAQKQRWKLVDAPQQLAQQCPGGILDQTVLEDHVHPTIEGHQTIGKALFDLATEHWGIPREGNSEVEIEAVFQTHFQSLPSAYFQRGRDRLQALNLWARGRAIGAKNREDDASD